MVTGAKPPAAGRRQAGLPRQRMMSDRGGTVGEPMTPILAPR